MRHYDPCCRHPTKRNCVPQLPTMELAPDSLEPAGPAEAGVNLSNWPFGDGSWHPWRFSRSNPIGQGCASVGAAGLLSRIALPDATA